MVSYTAPGTSTAITRNTGEMNVFVADLPLLRPIVFPDTVIGTRVAVPIEADPPATKFSASGLPTGLTMDAVTGMISGIPSAVRLDPVTRQPAPYPVLITLTNPTGSSTSAALPWLIQPVAPLGLGAFSGLVAPHAEMNAQLGAGFTLVTAAKGTFSGKTVVRGKAVSFKGTLDTRGGTATGRFQLSKGAAWSSFSIDLSTGALTGTLIDPATPSGPAAAVTAWLALTKAEIAAATGYVGSCNTALLPPAAAHEPGSALPAGTGFAVVTTAATGKATWTGTLADGTKLTGSSALARAGRMALHVELYAKTGSLSGYAQLTAATGYVEGALEWVKRAQAAGTSYRDGFAAHPLTLRGARWVAPGAGERLLGLPAAPPDNAELRCTYGGLSAAIAQSFELTADNKPLLDPAGVANPSGVTLTLSAKTGGFSGQFTAEDINPVNTATTLLRPTSFTGLIVQHPEVQRGVGQFQLAELPDAAGEALTTTPRWSGEVKLVPAGAP